MLVKPTFGTISWGTPSGVKKPPKADFATTVVGVDGVSVEAGAGADAGAGDDAGTGVDAHDDVVGGLPSPPPPQPASTAAAISIAPLTFIFALLASLAIVL